MAWGRLMVRTRPSLWAMVALAAIFIGCLPLLAFAQSIESDIADTAEHYIAEKQAAAAACDSQRYERAQLGLKGLLGQIDSDLAQKQAAEKSLYEEFTSAKVHVLSTLFGSKQEQDQLYANIKDSLRITRAQIGRLKKLRSEVAAAVNRRVAFDCQRTSIPATSTELVYWNPYVSILGGGTAGRTPFDVTPPFSAPGNGGFFEADIGLRTQVPAAPWMVGARFGVIAGPWGNAEFYPASGFDYSARQRFTGIAEITGAWDGSNQTLRIIQRLKVEASLGVAVGSREVVGRLDLPSFNVRDTDIDFGVTSSVRIEVPVTDYLSGLVQLRYLHTFPGTVNIPGPVSITSDIWYFGAGISIKLNPPLRRGDDRYPVM